MNGEQHEIPSWVRRAVTTAELPASRVSPSAESDEAGSPRQVHVDPPTPFPGNDPAPADDSFTPSTKRTRMLGAAVVGFLLAVSLALLVLNRGPTDRIATDSAPGDAAATGNDNAATTVIEVEPSSTTEAPEEVDATIPGLSAATIDRHRGDAWASGESSWAIFADGHIYLQGEVPEAAAVEVMTERLETILGPDKVVAQFEIDPTSPVPIDPPLFIKETVIFEPRTETMAAGSEWILVLTDRLMKRYPASTLTVVANPSTSQQPGDPTDLPERRMEAVIEFLADLGVDRSRLGSQLQSNDVGNSDEADKPIEFVVRGLLAQTEDLSP